MIVGIFGNALTVVALLKCPKVRNVAAAFIIRYIVVSVRMSFCFFTQCANRLAIQLEWNVCWFSNNVFYCLFIQFMFIFSLLFFRFDIVVYVLPIACSVRLCCRLMLFVSSRAHGRTASSYAVWCHSCNTVMLASHYYASPWSQSIGNCQFSILHFILSFGLAPLHCYAVWRRRVIWFTSLFFSIFLCCSNSLFKRINLSLLFILPRSISSAMM